MSNSKWHDGAASVRHHSANALHAHDTQNRALQERGQRLGIVYQFIDDDYVLLVCVRPFGGQRRAV